MVLKSFRQNESGRPGELQWHSQRSTHSVSRHTDRTIEETPGRVVSISLYYIISAGAQEFGERVAVGAVGKGLIKYFPRQPA